MMSQSALEEYVSIDNFDTPQQGLFKIVVDHYWLVSSDGKPLMWCGRSGGRGLQCNKDDSIIKALCKGREYKLFPVVFVPIAVDNFEYNV